MIRCARQTFSESADASQYRSVSNLVDTPNVLGLNPQSVHNARENRQQKKTYDIKEPMHPKSSFAFSSRSLLMTISVGCKPSHPISARTFIPVEFRRNVLRLSFPSLANPQSRVQSYAGSDFGSEAWMKWGRVRMIYWVAFVDGSTSIESRRSGVVNLSNIVVGEREGGQLLLMTWITLLGISLILLLREISWDSCDFGSGLIR